MGERILSDFVEHGDVGGIALVVDGFQNPPLTIILGRELGYQTFRPVSKFAYVHFYRSSTGAALRKEATFGAAEFENRDFL